MEYCSGGTLFNYLKKRKYVLPEPLAANIIYKICLAVSYFHYYGIAHRDLKLENILMTNDTDNAEIRILDFGLGKIIGPNETCSEPYGTITYCAPEIILSQPYTKDVDCWSIGVLTYVLLYGRYPFWGKGKPMIRNKIINSKPEYKGYNIEKISDEAKKFIHKFLKKNPNKRMKIQEALDHKWFKKYNITNIANIEKMNNEGNIILNLYNLLNKNLK